MSRSKMVKKPVRIYKSSFFNFLREYKQNAGKKPYQQILKEAARSYECLSHVQKLMYKGMAKKARDEVEKNKKIKEPGKENTKIKAILRSGAWPIEDPTDIIQVIQTRNMAKKEKKLMKETEEETEKEIPEPPETPKTTPKEKIKGRKCVQSYKKRLPQTTIEELCELFSALEI